MKSRERCWDRRRDCERRSRRKRARANRAPNLTLNLAWIRNLRSSRLKVEKYCFCNFLSNQSYHFASTGGATRISLTTVGARWPLANKSHRLIQNSSKATFWTMLRKNVSWYFKINVLNRKYFFLEKSGKFDDSNDSPWSSASLFNGKPDRTWSPSTFCVIKNCNFPELSKATSAKWVKLGIAFSHSIPPVTVSPFASRVQTPVGPRKSGIP